MARHPSLKITDEQEANLRKLAAYLLTLPADYPDFAMRTFVKSTEGYGYCCAHIPECGTAACAAGHGPMAGILPSGTETWAEYSHRCFTLECDDGQWDWCFSASWSSVDNTAHGAAARILWMLEHGVPDEADDQRWGEAELCYAARSGEVA